MTNPNTPSDPHEPSPRGIARGARTTALAGAAGFAGFVLGCSGSDSVSNTIDDLIADSQQELDQIVDQLGADIADDIRNEVQGSNLAPPSIPAGAVLLVKDGTRDVTFAVSSAGTDSISGSYSFNSQSGDFTGDYTRTGDNSARIELILSGGPLAPAGTARYDLTLTFNADGQGLAVGSFTDADGNTTPIDGVFVLAGA
jgi:hypothetical protein